MISPEQSSQGDALESCLSFRLQPATPLSSTTPSPTPQSIHQVTIPTYSLRLGNLKRQPCFPFDNEAGYLLGEGCGPYSPFLRNLDTARNRTTRTHYEMDALVAKYRRPAGMMEESFGEEEAQDMMALENPALSLKFAMPPVTHVSAGPICSYAPSAFLFWGREPQSSKR